jgi:hypothetical protein
MKNKKRARARRVTNTFAICTVIGVVLIVSTFAWFIGMRTVNVSSFDVKIASTESLLLSLNGQAWDTTVSITQETVDDVSYNGHTNSWGGKGLIPMSTVGDMDAMASRMKLYEKASLTTTPGGYRLMASRVHNYEADAEEPSGFVAEQDGYVVFDLFIKNFSGNQYITTLNPLDEEAIFLTADSAVTIAADGIANTGIENSVRVAFTQVGRVIGTTTNVATITGITCEPDGDGNPSVNGLVTGICRKGQIWEPNDIYHVANAINWYSTSCKPRLNTGADVTLSASYNLLGACGNVVDGTPYQTYVVGSNINSADNVDIYDGAAYNTYTHSAKLVAYPFFTDTMKEKTGTERPTLMTLAPNSITKLRIYVYIEGQDIDNYDFASIGKKIAVNFGFTKERFNEGDIEYDGPEIHVPVITLSGENNIHVPFGGPYNDAGATALDNVDGDLTADIVKTGTVDVDTPGDYTITYNVSDNAGHSATPVTRTVTVDPE